MAVDGIDGSIKIGAEIDVKALQASMKKLDRINSNGTQMATNAFIATGASVAALGGIIARSGVKFNAEMEQYSASFETMLGSAEKADKMLSNLKEFAKNTPFEMGDLAGSTKMLLAFGVAEEDVMGTMQMLGDISQGNGEAFERLSRTFGQVSSAGKLTAEDLNSMIDSGFNPLQIISEKTGESMTSLRDKMSKGAISVDMVTDAMKTATSEGGLFYKAMEKQSKTLMGQWSTLKDNFGAKSGEIMKPLTDSITNVALPALNNLIENFDTSAIIDNVTSMSQSFGSFIANDLSKFIDFVMGAGHVVGALGEIVFDNSEIIIAAIGGVGVALITLKTVDALTKITAAWQTATIQIVLYSLQAETAAISQGVLTGAFTAFEIVVGVLTGKIGIATAAQGLWNIVTTAFPGAAIALAIGAVVGGLALFAMKANETSKETKSLFNISVITMK